MAESMGNPGEAVYRPRRRELDKTHFFRMASKMFGHPSCRVRVMTAVPAPAPLRPRLWPRPRRQPADVERDVEGAGGWGVSEYTEWLAMRKRQRAELETMADVKRWINSKISANDLELRVLEGLESGEWRAKATAPTPPVEPELQSERSASQKQNAPGKFYGIIPLINLPSLEPVKLLNEYLDKKRLRLVDFFRSSDRGKKGKLSKDDLKVAFEKANLPITDRQMGELIATHGDHARYLHYKVLTQALNVWKGELQQKKRNKHIQKEGGLPEITRSSLRPNKVELVEDFTVQSDRIVRKTSCYLKVPAVDLRESRPFTAEELEQLEMRKQDMNRMLKTKLHHKDLLENCLLVGGEKRSMACHSLPTTMGGEMGEAANTYRKRCLTEYKKILKMCQYYGISFTERMLEKALLHPGDKLTIEPELSLKLRHPGTSVLSDDDVEQWLSTRQQIAMDQLSHELTQMKGDVQINLELENSSLEEASEEPETKLRQQIAVDQLNHELVQMKGDVQKKLELETSSLKEASEEPETKLRQQIAVDQLNHEQAPRKGVFRRKLKLNNSSLKKVSEEPGTKLRVRCYSPR
ncbi:EF-hand calcium-binding domain-containing protein 12 isoform X2 [Heterodontus francisci]|uniref:EF-hand calcium-binding domain-containing protein 12 isoform X2 n=1 Tax=Heterodontus francisci TaxID=7792 RepID=UPI00355AFA14